MRRTIFFSAVLSVAAIPAFAAWERIGSLDVAAGKTEQFNMENFKGNVIGLTARESDIMCDRVTATFDNGEMRPVFKGKLPKGLSVRVDLPPGAVERGAFCFGLIRLRCIACGAWHRPPLRCRRGHARPCRSIVSACISKAPAWVASHALSAERDVAGA